VLGIKTTQESNARSNKILSMPHAQIDFSLWSLHRDILVLNQQLVFWF
jgi:hypothetical protein